MHDGFVFIIRESCIPLKPYRRWCSSAIHLRLRARSRSPCAPPHHCPLPHPPVPRPPPPSSVVRHCVPAIPHHKFSPPKVIPFLICRTTKSRHTKCANTHFDRPPVRINIAFTDTTSCIQPTPRPPLPPSALGTGLAVGFHSSSATHRDVRV